jgi:type I restriction-modification system DNA methylase subunit/restriction endonuclease S subunit
MLNKKTYSCGICNTTPDQISHHKSHIETQKHKDKLELMEFKLSKLTNQELEEKYKTHNINDIVREIETIIYTPIDKINLLNKKLTENKINNKNDISEYMNTAIEQTNSVSNKEALKDKIHEIHNFLRNNGAGYGMNALKVFNIIYGLKKIEENGLFDKVSLKKPDCEFSYLLKLANENKDEQLADLIFGNVLQSICDSELKELLFYEIPQNIRGSVFVYLIREIDKITIIEKTCNVLLSGKIYEYFIGRDESAISELGAYFTDRHITKFSLRKANPKMNEDGTIPSMIDMFGGSGGFTTEYINYLNETYPQLINWAIEINKIYHYDMNEDVIKSAGLELFCLTGVLPNMNNLKYKNSFTDEFNENKYRFVFTNPPYGGDKNSKTKAQNKRDKVKEYIKNELHTITDEGLRIRRQKQLKKIEAQEKQEKKEQDKTKVSVASCSARIQKFAKDNNLKGNDKESCSLMLLMDILEIDGTAVGVLKEGVFFNKTYKDLRKCLVENFNVREVISVPQDQFENTSTKTSIVIFDNTEEKTTEVKFSNLEVERYQEDKFAEVFGDIVIIENKGDIKGVNDVLVSQATREELLSNPICSLNGKDYNKKIIVVGVGYELVKLEDICEIICGKNLPKDKAINGIYNVYGGGNSSYTHDEYNIEGFNIILSRVGNNNISLINEKIYLTDNGFSLNIKDELTKKFIGYYLYGKKEQIFNLGNGSAQKVITKTQLKQLKVPIPKSPTKIQEWVDKISAPYNEKNEKQTRIQELETFIQNRIREIEENEECDEVDLGSVCEIKSGKAINSENRKGNLYPYYAANGISGYVDDYLFYGKFIICAQDGSIGATHLVNCKFYASNHVWVLKIENMNPYYIYSILKNNIDYSKITSGSVIPKLTREKITKIKIKIPKNKQLIQDLEPKFQQIETLQTEVKLAEELYKKYIKDLSEEAIPNK